MVKREKNNQVYYIYIAIFIAINFLYFYLNMGNNDEFKTLVSFYASLSIFISSYSLYLQINSSKLNRISSDVAYVNKIFSDIDFDVYNFFSKNTKINYYYDELYKNISNYKEEERDKQLEKLISFRILSNVETLINYTDALKLQNGSSSEIEIAEIRLKKLLEMFLKSKIFVENWKEYSTTIAMDWTRDYFDLYFEYY